MEKFVPSCIVLGAIWAAAMLSGCGQSSSKTDPVKVDNKLAQGREVYVAHCAACHGINLEGQPNWKERRADGKLPAPPHDASGHTWEHPDQILFEVTKYGFAGKVGPNYKTDMPGFENRLSDEQIWAVIAYIKSTWPERIRKKLEPRK